MDQESFISVMAPGIDIRMVSNHTDGNRVMLLDTTDKIDQSRSVGDVSI